MQLTTMLAGRNHTMTVERIFIGQTPGGPQVEREQVVVAAGSGIEGDRYFGRHNEPGQNITLIEAEEIEAFSREHRRLLDFSTTHRNLITRGIRLNELVGREFLIGNVKLRGVELCEPCLGMGTALASEQTCCPMESLRVEQRLRRPPNPSIERTATGKPVCAAHVKR